MTTFVSVGNAHQPFNRLIDAVVALADRLPQPIVIQYGHSHCISDRIHRVSFMNMDDFERKLVQARLLILHAGCGVLINAMRNGRIPVVMARRKQFGEMVDDHQVELADALSAQKKILLADTSEELWPAIQKAMTLSTGHKVDVKQRNSFKAIHATLRKYQRAFNE